MGGVIGLGRVGQCWIGLGKVSLGREVVRSNDWS